MYFIFRTIQLPHIHEAVQIGMRDYGGNIGRRRWDFGRRSKYFAYINMWAALIELLPSLRRKEASQ